MPSRASRHGRAWSVWQVAARYWPVGSFTVVTEPSPPMTLMVCWPAVDETVIAVTPPVKLGLIFVQALWPGSQE